MYLVQLLLPVSDNSGARFPGEAYGRVRRELVNLRERFAQEDLVVRASPMERL